MTVDHSRCCAIHGCRHGELTCPIVKGSQDQAEPCPHCLNMGLKNVPAIHAYLGRGPVQKICPTCGQPTKPRVIYAPEWNIG